MFSETPNFNWCLNFTYKKPRGSSGKDLFFSILVTQKVIPQIPSHSRRSACILFAPLSTRCFIFFKLKLLRKDTYFKTGCCIAYKRVKRGKELQKQQKLWRELFYTERKTTVSFQRIFSTNWTLEDDFTSKQKIKYKKWCSNQLFIFWSWQKIDLDFFWSFPLTMRQ